MSRGLGVRPLAVTVVRSVGVRAATDTQAKPSRHSDVKEVLVAAAPGGMLDYVKVAAVGAKGAVFERKGASARVPMGTVFRRSERLWGIPPFHPGAGMRGI